MHSYSKDGIIVTSMLDTRTPNAQGEYPVKIRVNYKRVRAYYPTGKNLTPENWDNQKFKNLVYILNNQLRRE
jgi:integrase/recombinase XerD